MSAGDQDRTAPDGCVVEMYSSRACERGTKACTVRHETSRLTDVQLDDAEALTIEVRGAERFASIKPGATFAQRCATLLPPLVAEVRAARTEVEKLRAELAKVCAAVAAEEHGPNLADDPEENLRLRAAVLDACERATSGQRHRKAGE